jgi:hypothetical protein
MNDTEAKCFFDLTADAYVPGRWYMAEPTTPDGQEIEDVWAFSYGEPVAPPGPLRIPLSRPGNPLDFTTSGVGMKPILSARTANVFREMAPHDVQLFPVDVEGQAEPYYLLVVARTVRCIDDAACEEAQRYTVADGRPERVDRYQAISGLRIDKSKVGDARVFRLWGWSPALIVAGEIKSALEQVGVVGGYFEEV